MAKMYDYRVCQVQQQYVTFVNGEWQGRVPLAEAAAAADPFASCPHTWDYLQRVGPDGWELVATVTHQPRASLSGSVTPASGAVEATLAHESYDIMYLKREL
ncbi:MAG TPA: hypothetical protein VF546_01035 [Pyrinomonadaceae bacterium]|jgi:hypothetical protein